MPLTDEEKLALLEVPYEPEEGENIHLVLEKVPGEKLLKIVGVFTDEQHPQANALSCLPGRIVRTVKANKILDGGITDED